MYDNHDKVVLAFLLWVFADSVDLRSRVSADTDVNLVRRREVTWCRRQVNNDVTTRLDRHENVVLFADDDVGVDGVCDVCEDHHCVVWKRENATTEWLQQSHVTN